MPEGVRGRAAAARGALEEAALEQVGLVDVLDGVLLLLDGDRELSFISTVATFGTAVDVTVAELSIEAFFPADAETASALRAFS